MDVEDLDFTVKVRTQGRITIPESVRIALGIKEGDIVQLTIRRVIEDRP